MRLAGKIALVTGAQQGIGKAIALAYGREGASVVVNYLDNQAAAEEIASQIRALGQQAVPVAGDVARAADVRRMVEAGEGLGGIDILVNNAGIFPRVEFLDMTEAPSCAPRQWHRSWLNAAVPGRSLISLPVRHFAVHHGVCTMSPAKLALSA
jgi:NAD(P)-dependent dehydrogenase (short-subunit alcohol dehydrogenase family)